MGARLVPLFFPNRDEGFDIQVDHLRNLLIDEAIILDPVALGEDLPEAEAVVFPQVLGDAYRMLEEFRALDRPILFITSEFGTMSMWDWEIGSYLASEGITTIAPYSLEQAKTVCRALSSQSQLHTTKFLAFQDNPGEGFQPGIFKRFYWWENEATQRMFDNFGITIEHRSFKKMGAEAKEISNEAAEKVWNEWQDRLNIAEMPRQALLSALKIYIRMKQELDAEPNIGGIGINCLNESHYSDTTPCLAWNMLYEERGLIWGCEADTITMLSKFILHKSLQVPIMMTNLYPFLMGQAALKHERIPNFPEVEANPENHILVAHCGYLGVLPQSFSTEWTLQTKVLGIVNDNATAIDARLPIGEVTLAKLHADFKTMTVAQGTLTGYAQFPGSDCVNGGIIRVNDGHKLMTSLASHHYLLMTGHNLPAIRLMAKIFNFNIVEI
ncbi:MAG: hypothetical protein RLP44_09915 [Aggregatilineales bacterium]